MWVRSWSEDPSFIEICKLCMYLHFFNVKSITCHLISKLVGRTFSLYNLVQYKNINPFYLFIYNKIWLFWHILSDFIIDTNFNGKKKKKEQLIEYKSVRWHYEYLVLINFIQKDNFYCILTTVILGCFKKFQDDHIFFFDSNNENERKQIMFLLV